MSRTYKTEGIILKRFNLGEADRILTIYTKHYGKIRTIAKGVRKITSRKGGHVEPFNHLVLFLARGRNLDILTEAQVVNSLWPWRKDLKKAGLAYYFCELVDKLTPDRQANKTVFELLRSSLSEIGDSPWQSRPKRKFRTWNKKHLRGGAPPAGGDDSSDGEGSSLFVRGFEEKLLDELGFGVPHDLRERPDSLKSYIEEIVEKKINSPKIASDIV